MTEKLTLRDNAAVRWAALLLLALAMFCSYIFMDILSPIKDLMPVSYTHLDVYKRQLFTRASVF